MSGSATISNHKALGLSLKSLERILPSTFEFLRDLLLRPKSPYTLIYGIIISFAVHMFNWPTNPFFALCQRVLIVCQLTILISLTLRIVTTHLTAAVLNIVAACSRDSRAKHAPDWCRADFPGNRGQSNQTTSSTPPPADESENSNQQPDSRSYSAPRSPSSDPCLPEKLEPSLLLWPLLRARLYRDPEQHRKYLAAYR